MLENPAMGTVRFTLETNGCSVLHLKQIDAADCHTSGTTEFKLHKKPYSIKQETASFDDFSSLFPLLFLVGKQKESVRHVSPATA